MTSLNNSGMQRKTVAIIGGGPAGLMAAEALAAGGVQVDVYDAMPSVGRKFLLAGKGGMNLTHSEPYDAFLSRYGSRAPQIAPLLAQFTPDALREWVHGLGIETFVGSSGRVFPTDMKAAPLLRAWLHRLRQAGVRFHMRHRWLGWTETATLCFDTPQGLQAVSADAVVMALGGGSWARLGSDARWVPLLSQRDIAIAPLQPSNCGFEVGWSEYFRSRFAGDYLKSVAIAVQHEGDPDAQPPSRKQGEFVITAEGIEGSLIYALSAGLRDRISASGTAVIQLDLLPDWPLQRVIDEVTRPRGARSWSSHLQSRLGLKGVKTGLLRELVSAADFADPLLLAHAIKALPLTLLAARPIDEAISSAGGVTFEGMDQQLMLKALPGVFCAGEMLDWEAPTGGYLLSACMASGRAAGNGVLSWLQ
ncbi:hypothetical protein SAMN04515618_10689 [Collimonas sp. OK307]|uniref:TIGR03862 family flavoprotein n=1 Tax=Collimonas sp. OK307 TaxID=1801620 RepID=UPI0008E98370|nr:hypothetical protein SAMN04515618_10689 [Collimonas sp. OK307]